MAARPNDVVSFVRRHREGLAVVGLLLVALGLRLYQVNWDDGHLYHPDERYILMTTAALSLSWPLNFNLLLSPQSTLDPHGFAYGTFSFYLLRLVAAILIWIGHLFPSFHFLDQLTDLGNLRLIGRPISALFDTGSVYIIYRIGRQMFGKRIAFLGAALVTFSVIDIQLSHFYATDTILTAFGLAAILASIEYARAGRRSSAVWAGVFTGLALGTKVSAAPILAPVLLAHLIRQCMRDEDGRPALHWPDLNAVFRSIPSAVGTLIVAAIVFVVVEPYAIIDFHNFVQGFSDQGAMVRGIADLPYTRQYFGRPAYLYFLQNLLLFGVGVPLGVAMLAGIALLLWRTIDRPGPGEILLLSYVLPYFAITGDFYAKFMRYLLPITPLLALCAAFALIRLLDVVRSWRDA
ncbi:MAG TPA: glycosyltransferase family 39 protein, partial [Chloroflexota bacterium]|nr:glycosyltransferase family 39 protein [Chloroflexota bacterium]